jgi:hypothetical protein
LSIAKACAKGQADTNLAQAALPLVNTAAALLLNIAGLYGIKLPGVTGLQ